MPPIDPGMEQRFRDAIRRERSVLEALVASTHCGPSDKQRANRLIRAGDRGLDAVLARLGPETSGEFVSLVRDFTERGSKAVLSTGAQRGGDFLLNQLRGRWAEEVVLTMSDGGVRFVPFGPSGAAMPGEEDHRNVVQTFREIEVLEGKRPDLLAFKDSEWLALSEDARKACESWPTRRLEAFDLDIVKRCLCGVEVKNSAWHYETRRKAGGGPISVVVKEEELEILRQWAAEIGRPVLFMQVFFDEIYRMNFVRMCNATDCGRMYAEGDYLLDRQTGEKAYHHFYLNNFDHLCGKVRFPSESRGVIRVLADGAVIPHIVYAPAESFDVEPDTIIREINFAAAP